MEFFSLPSHRNSVFVLFSFSPKHAGKLFKIHCKLIYDNWSFRKQVQSSAKAQSFNSSVLTFMPEMLESS